MAEEDTLSITSIASNCKIRLQHGGKIYLYPFANGKLDIVVKLLHLLDKARKLYRKTLNNNIE